MANNAIKINNSKYQSVFEIDTIIKNKEKAERIIMKAPSLRFQSYSISPIKKTIYKYINDNNKNNNKQKFISSSSVNEENKYNYNNKKSKKLLSNNNKSYFINKNLRFFKLSLKLFYELSRFYAIFILNIFAPDIYPFILEKELDNFLKYKNKLILIGIIQIFVIIFLSN